MNINQLIKKLQKLSKEVGPRTEVVINTKAINSEYSHPSFEEIDIEMIDWFIDDNSELKSGVTRQRKVVSLGGIE